MHQDDINLAKGEIERAVRKTPYGDGLPLHISLLRLAIAEIESLRAEVERLNSRDGKASIYLCVGNNENPFQQEKLEVVDFGVSDNDYIVKSKIFVELQNKLAEAEKIKERLDWMVFNSALVLYSMGGSFCWVKWVGRNGVVYTSKSYGTASEAIDAAIASQQSDGVDGQRGGD